MVLFHNYSELLLKKIIIKKAVIFSEKYRTRDIKYKVKNEEAEPKYLYEDIFIQTPFILLRYAPHMYEGNIDSKIVLDIPLKIKKEKEKEKEGESDTNNESDRQSEEFCQLVKKVHKSLKTKLIKLENEKLKEIKDTEDKIKKNKDKKRELYVECLKEKKDEIDRTNRNYNLKTKIHSLNGKPYVKIYTSNRKLCKEQKFKHNTLTRFILHLESIWYFEDTYGFNWYVVQAEIKLPNIPNNYFFHNTNDLPKEDEIDNTSSPNPVLQKYHKMLSMGIPKDAVKNKMKMDGIQPELLDSNISNGGGIPPPPPPPPTMLLNVKLKKSEPNEKKLEKVIVPKVDSMVPSLSQLQAQLGKLRKIKKK